MKKLSRIEWTVVRALFRSRAGLLPLTFWKRYQIAATDLAGAIESLTGLGLVTFDGVRITLTESGARGLLETAEALSPEDETPWRTIPEWCLAPRVMAGEPITPVMKMIDCSILPPEYWPKPKESKGEPQGEGQSQS